ncbi:MAG: 4-amino-4-deoxy-L-arabinose-phosphoundecaprenol flippase subunit ArnE [Candidatus Micrarchaeota archaeon]|nr:MAG: 4-amino-4-deoxy-L-arabinose-phosphoundecaprenol flippase subunit ArnE [Candidatus Micrarchaeota archaeon]
MRRALLIILILIINLLGAFGQISLKIYADYNKLLVFLILGLLLYISSTFLYLYLLTFNDLSWSYSIISLSYLFTDILSVIIFKSSIPLDAWIGALLIVIGIVLISYKKV